MVTTGFDPVVTISTRVGPGSRLRPSVNLTFLKNKSVCKACVHSAQRTNLCFAISADLPDGTESFIPSSKPLQAEVLDNETDEKLYIVCKVRLTNHVRKSGARKCLG